MTSSVSFHSHHYKHPDALFVLLFMLRILAKARVRNLTPFVLCVCARAPVWGRWSGFKGCYWKLDGKF